MSSRVQNPALATYIPNRHQSYIFSDSYRTHFTSFISKFGKIWSIGYRVTEELMFEIFVHSGLAFTSASAFKLSISQSYDNVQYLKFCIGLRCASPNDL